MKKLIGISLFSVSFLFISCEKEQVKATDSRTAEAPEWQEKRGAIVTGGTSTTTTVSGSGITDPNNDPDMSSKKVIKQ